MESASTRSSPASGSANRVRDALAKAAAFASRIDQRLLVALFLVLEAAIFWLDDYTGPLVSFASYYVLPVAACTWFVEDSAYAYLFIVLSASARVYVHDQLLMGHHLRLYLYCYEFAQSVFLYAIVEFLVRKIKSQFQIIGTHSKGLEQRLRIENSIRKAIVEDAEAIMRLNAIGAEEGVLSGHLLEIERQKVLVEAYKQGITEGAALRDVWEGGQENVPVDLWVSEINGNIAGYIMILGLDKGKDLARELHTVVVSREYRGLGIGSAMTDFFCSHYDHRRLIVACKPGSQMMTMVERRGFKPYSSGPNSYILLERRGGGRVPA